jgi:hypothetical protein
MCNANIPDLGMSDELQTTEIASGKSHSVTCWTIMLEINNLSQLSISSLLFE